MTTAARDARARDLGVRQGPGNEQQRDSDAGGQGAWGGFRRDRARGRDKGPGTCQGPGGVARSARIGVPSPFAGKAARPPPRPAPPPRSADTPSLLAPQPHFRQPLSLPSTPRPRQIPSPTAFPSPPPGRRGGPPPQPPPPPLPPPRAPAAPPGPIGRYRLPWVDHWSRSTRTRVGLGAGTRSPARGHSRPGSEETRDTRDGPAPVQAGSAARTGRVPGRVTLDAGSPARVTVRHGRARNRTGPRPSRPASGPGPARHLLAPGCSDVGIAGTRARTHCASSHALCAH